MNIIEIRDKVILKDGSIDIVKGIFYQLERQTELIPRDDLVFADSIIYYDYRVGPNDFIFNYDTERIEIIKNIEIITKSGKAKKYRLIRNENLDKFRKQYYEKWAELHDKVDAAQKELKEFESGMPHL